MKRRLIGLLLAIMLLTGCASPGEIGMTLSPAQLTDAEAAVAELLGANRDQLLLDFHLDDSVQSLHVTAYELRGGAWEPISGGGGMWMNEPEGRMALGFDVIPDGMRIAVQAGEISSSTTHTAAVQLDAEGMGRSTSRMANAATVEYEKEIPVACQIITSKNEIHSFNTDYFADPSHIAQQGYEHVYCITLMFSALPLE